MNSGPLSLRMYSGQPLPSVFYHGVACTINNRDDVALQVMHIAVHGAVIVHLGGPILGIVIEVQGVTACHRHVRDVLATKM